MNTSLKATPSRAPKHIRALALSATVGLAMAGASLPAAAAPTADIGGILLEGEEPIANALVTAYTLDGESPEFEAEARTDEAGEWELRNLPDGDYTLEFSTDHSSAQYALGETLSGATDLADEPTGFVIDDGEASEAPFEEVTLTRLGGAIEMQIVDEEGEPFIDLDDAASELRGLSSDGEEWNSRTFWADEDGRITVPRIPLGGYVPWIGVEGEELAPTATGVVVEAETTTVVGSFEVPERAESEFEVSGEFAIDGEGTVGETLTVQWPSTTPDPGSTQVTWARAGEVLASDEGEYLATEDDVDGGLDAWGFIFADGYAPVIATDSTEIAPGSDDGGGGSGDGGSGEDGPDGGGGDGDPDGAGDGDSDSGDDLPLTGVSIALLVAAMIGLLVVGGFAYRASRTR